MTERGALRLRPGDDGSMVVDARQAGWRYLGFALHRLTSDALAPLAIGHGERETAVVILAGGALMTFESEPPIRLPGRPSVFGGLPWAAYLPPGRTAWLEPMGEAVEVAVADAPASVGAGAGSGLTVIGPDAVGIELRGAGSESCQVDTILGAGGPALRLVLREVLVPAGNRTNWPQPQDAPDEADHFRFRGPAGNGVLRLRAPGAPEQSMAVATADTVIMPGGRHTFEVSAGADAYYLRALAGDGLSVPAVEGGAAIEMGVDPRLPLVGR